MGYSRGVSRLQRMRIAMFTSAACSENGYKQWGLPMGNLIALTLLAEAKQGRDGIDR